MYGLSSDGLTSLKNWKEVRPYIELKLMSRRQEMHSSDPFCFASEQKRSFQYSLLSDPKRQLIGALTGSKTSTPRG